ncbi:MAG TPA: DnaA N-terminal domain-containing protein, partial [Solirubrobacteraceae bacterium]|nr:DnaA N-terminal domain-containing protein [Solirubrobacteraceae bacterium]
MSAELQYIWSRVQAELAAAIEDSSYRIWLSPLIPRELADGVLTLEATPQTQRWVADRYGRLLNTCASRVLSHDVQVRLLTPADTPELAADHAPVSSAAPPPPPPPPPPP